MRSVQPHRVLGLGGTAHGLAFGGAPLGNLYREVSEEVAEQAIEAAWAGGIRYFDTAPHYGLGLSERRLGRALSGRPRESFVLSTKVGRLLVDNPTPTGSDLTEGFGSQRSPRPAVGLLAGRGPESLFASLERLGLDRVDIAYVHDPDDHLDAAVTTALPALAELRDEGVVGAIGAGMNSVAPLRRIVREVDVDVVMVAGRWTLLDHTAEPLLDECLDRGVAVVAAAPFNSGLLAATGGPGGPGGPVGPVGSTRPGLPSGDLRWDYAPAAPELVTTAWALEEVAARHGTSLLEAAIRFPARHPAVVAVVAGMRSAAEVHRNLVAMSTRTPPDALWAELDAALAGTTVPAARCTA